MEQRTCNIIMCCKGNCNLPGSGGDALHDVAVYLGKECDVPPSSYSPERLEGLMLAALYDYMDGADHPGSDLRNYFNYFDRKAPVAKRVASVFALCQVRDGDSFVNGFSRELLERAEKELGFSD